MTGLGKPTTGNDAGGLDAARVPATSRRGAYTAALAGFGPTGILRQSDIDTDPETIERYRHLLSRSDEAGPTARCRGGTAARLPRGPRRHGRWHAAQARRPDHHAGRRRARRRASGSGSALAHHRRVRQGDRCLRIAPDRRRFGPRVPGDPSGDPQAAARSRLIARPLGGHGRLPASASRTPAGPKGWRASAGDLSRSGTRPKSGAAVTPPPPPCVPWRARRI